MKVVETVLTVLALAGIDATEVICPPAELAKYPAVEKPGMVILSTVKLPITALICGIENISKLPEEPGDGP